ncbi:MAG: PhoPQ-activated protein PqaA family protein [Armatimonadota bacterium]|nr:acetylxylan esterase [bacterium]
MKWMAIVATVFTCLSVYALPAIGSGAGSAVQKTAGFDPGKFWSMDEIRKIPLDIEIVSSKIDNSYRLDEIYFTSEIHPDGPTRIFIAFARPVDPKKPVPVYFDIHGGGGHADPGRALWFAREMQCAAVSIDWSGEFIKGADRYTIWRGPNPNPYMTSYNVTPDAKSSSLYRIVMAIRRAMDFLGTQKEVDANQIACGGGSWGGFLSNLLAGVDERVKCTTCALGAGAFKESTKGTIAAGANALPPTQRRLWIAAFDPASYASRVTAPTMQYACANDYFFWLGDVQDNYRMLHGNKRFLIRPNSNHECGGPQTPFALMKWVSACLMGDMAFPKIVPGSFRKSGRIYTWKCEGPVDTNKSTLYWSPGDVSWPSRYWLAIPAAKKGNVWQAQVPERFAGLSCQVFATVFDMENRAISTEVVHHAGQNPCAQRGPLWADDAIWDKQSGADAWRPTGSAVNTGPGDTRIETASNGVVTIGPGKGNTQFAALTNSIILANGYANSNKGIRLTINGNGQFGSLTVTLQRNSGCTNEVAYTAQVKYGPASTTINIPWSAFKAPKDAPVVLYPFDGFRIDGTRSDDSPITIESLELL